MLSGETPGRLLGSGRSADVYALGESRVLRRYRVPIDVAAEARLMRYLSAAGYPVPEVFDADGRDLVLERLDGVDMLADLGRRPWLIARHARTLADLHDRLHQIAAPASLPDVARPGGGGGGDGGDGGDGGEPGQGRVVLHMDLHPGNVMLASRGPVVIDWVGARAGAAGTDVAMAYLIMTTAETDVIPIWLRPVIGVLRTTFCRRFAAGVRDSPWPHIASAARLRMADINTRPSEAGRLQRIAERAESAERAARAG
jgi:aminoglycoside phosphotransferase (APT) family kinase protein